MHGGVRIAREANHLTMDKLRSELKPVFAQTMSVAGIDIGKRDGFEGVYFLFKINTGGVSTSRIYANNTSVPNSVISRLHVEDAREIPTVVLIIKHSVWKTHNNKYTVTYVDDPLHKSEVLGCPIVMQMIAENEKHKVQCKAKFKQLATMSAELNQTKKAKSDMDRELAEVKDDRKKEREFLKRECEKERGLKVEAQKKVEQFRRERDDSDRKLNEKAFQLNDVYERLTTALEKVVEFQDQRP